MHVSDICRSLFNQLRNLSKIRKYPTQESSKIAVYAFITSKLDYCNSLLYGCRKMQLKKLQHVQNTAARIVSQTRKFDHITPVLSDLHWLPVSYRIVFKILLLVFKTLILITFHLAIWRTDLVINRIPGTCGPHLSSCWNNLDHSRKLTGTRLFQCVPLNCGIHYH